MGLRAIVGCMLAGTVMMATGCSASGRRVLVIAHRGDSGHYPENTLTAFRQAAEKGADLVELDTHATKDGVLVAIHDGTLDRTTNSVKAWGKTEQAVAAYPYEAIRKLDAGSWKSPTFAGERIPTLAESVETINARSMTLLERKAGSALAHAKYLRAAGQIDRTVVQSFDWDFVAAMHTLVPEVRLAALGGEAITEETVADLCMTGAKIAAWNHKELNRDSMALLRKAGLTVWTYTIDDAKKWEHLYRLGVDGIITNKPKECRAWLEERTGK